MSGDNGWAQLVSTSDIHAEPRVIKNKKFFMGRSNGVDLCLHNNKLVSGTHCYIEKDEQGQVWLQDCSTNGTLLNLTRKLVGQKTALSHGDEISLVYKKDNPAQNVSYVFQDLGLLAEEENDETQSYTSELNSSTAPESDGLFETSSPPIKRKFEMSFNESLEEGPIKKKTTPEEIHIHPAEKENNTTVESSVKVDEGPSESSSAIEGPFESSSAIEGPSKSSSAIQGPSESSSGVEKAGGKLSDAAVEEDGIEENLACLICQEIFYNCISLQPCMHSFCAGCYSEWMERSEACPSCRLKVDRINKNHIVNNLVEAYLKQHPDKQRSAEDIATLDRKNTITKESLKPPAPTRTIEDEGDGGGAAYGFVPHRQFTPAPLGRLTWNAVGRAPITVCRQCPNYQGPGGVAHVAAGTSTSTALATCGGAKVGTSSEPTVVITADGTPKTMPVPPNFNCGAADNSSHILCQCCLEFMPDRRGNVATPQTCSICYGMFCHEYWGCKRAACVGCLAEFKYLQFPKNALDGILLENVYESNILKDYLNGKSMSAGDFFKECSAKLESREYMCTDYRLKANTRTCFRCGLKNMRQLAYQYRTNIKKEDLPAAVGARPNCHWGRNCRTQRANTHHAMNFNHICDQTKF